MAQRQKEPLRPLTADERAELGRVARAGSEPAGRVLVLSTWYDAGQAAATIYGAVVAPPRLARRGGVASLSLGDQMTPGHRVVSVHPALPAGPCRT